MSMTVRVGRHLLHLDERPVGVLVSDFDEQAELAAAQLTDTPIPLACLFCAELRQLLGRDTRTLEQVIQDAQDEAGDPSLTPTLLGAILWLDSGLQSRLSLSDLIESVQRRIPDHEPLLRWMATKSSELAAAAASRRRLPEDLLRSLAAHESSWVRAAAAQNPDLSPDALITLLLDPNRYVCQAAFQNPTLSSDLISRAFPGAPSRGVLQKLIADCAFAPPPLLKELYLHNRHPHPLDFMLAVNVATPQDVLELLARSNRQEIRLEALRSLRIQSEIIDHEPSLP